MREALAAHYKRLQQAETERAEAGLNLSAAPVAA